MTTWTPFKHMDDALGVPVLGDVADERPQAGDEGLGVLCHGVPASPSRNAGIVMERRSAR